MGCVAKTKNDGSLQQEIAIQAVTPKISDLTENIFPCYSDDLSFNYHVHCLDTTYGISDRFHRETIEISLRNHKDKKVTITAVEHPNGDWKTRQSSHKLVKKDAHTIEFEVEVPARGEVKVNYEVEIRN